MSVESANDFLERMKTDEDFAKQVIACPDNESRIKFVRAAGFDFTPEELRPLREELSVEELDAVVAAGSPNPACGKGYIYFN